ncbi:zinc ABC transporter substrate-binding protein [Aliiroseovarius sp. S1339]|uniref:zinc ABC transporter substrate-binding protein n=1 Tax=Aliiroseovarius sp. S1339 TaxID=2936990 RepID=UPI0020C010F6|nr:zinc ABC transporter substrate-binding protein [Aliiroseovarius sp. S1339]MCK8462770.1 zinc ABC transporter substrate-binding protein [Aliiroseovarius sp. S1339]
MIRPLVSAILLSAAPTFADIPRVVTDFAPVHSLAASVMGDLSSPDLLLPQGGDPHAFQMRPSQMRALSQADLVFWVGPELTPWLERALDGVSQAQSIALLDAPGTHLRNSDHVHGEAEHNHRETEDHDEDAHDPHAWLSPENGATWLLVIAEALAAHDPENAQVYHANAAQARTDLAAIEAKIDDQLAPVRDRGFVVFHDAFGYFTDHFALSSLGAVRESDSAPPSASQLADIKVLFPGGKVHCAFAEAAEGEDMMRDLVVGTTIGFGVLDPSGAQQTPGPNLYRDLLLSLSDTITGCLSGKGG